MTDAEFGQADTNRDGRLDSREFSNFIGQSLSGGQTGGYGGSYGSGSSYGQTGGYGGSYGSGSNYGQTGGYEGSYGSGSNYGLGGSGVATGYESSSSYSSGTTGYGSADSVGNAAYGGAAGYGGGAGYGGASEYGGGAGYGGAAGYGGESSYNASSSNYSSSSAVQSYPTDAQGLFQDSNPQIVRRPAQGGNVTYTQNIRVRFLQPPPVPPPGPLIIREVRPPQPPPPPPLRIRQQAPSLPQPPPLVLRERPPVAPQSLASQTVIRRLAALPVPPRSVIIERLPAAPARPRDVIIERWVPYGAAAKRRTVVQRAAAAQQYQAPRNTIIQYESAQVRIARQFRNLGVTRENPQSYAQRYGGQLLDSVTLVRMARSAGVVEDISPPVVPGSFAATEGQFSSTGGAAGAGGLTGQGAGGIAGEINYEATAGGVGSRYSQGYSAYSQSGGGVVGLESPAAATTHIGGAGEGATGFGATPRYSTGVAGEESVAPGGFGALSGPGSAFAPNTLFNAADTNNDGAVSSREFNKAGY